MCDLEDNLESLFLLELLVDNVQFNAPPKENEDLRETCVGFQFLRYPPLIICEEDFVYMNDDEFNKVNVQFKSGKSLLFALPSLSDGCPDLGRINVWVTRRVGRTSQTKTMGTAEISLMGSFENLLIASAQQQSDACPVSKFLKDTYEFKNEGCFAGTICAFIRISCFGKLIVTQFEVKGKDLFNFKGGDADVEASPGAVTGTSKPATKARSASNFNQPQRQPSGIGQQGRFPGQPAYMQNMGQPGQFMPPGMSMAPGCPLPGGPTGFMGPPGGFQPGGYGMAGMPGGQPGCPCGQFPCSHPPPGFGNMGMGQQFSPQAGMMYQPNMMPPRPLQLCPTDRDTQVDQDMIAASSKASSRKDSAKGGKKDKKKKSAAKKK